MGTIGGYYIGDNESQFDGSAKQRENCVPTSVANGADNVTGGKINKTGGYVRGLVAPHEETDPSTPGWSLPDAVLAAGRLGVALVNRSGDGWAALESAWATGHSAIIQGDSDQFPNGTCSDKFDGDHCVEGHPATRVVNGLRQHVLQDPICKAWRWEYDYIIRRYATKLNSGIRFAVFTKTVPRAVVAPKVVTLKYGANASSRPVVRRIDVASGRKANVRLKPALTAQVMSKLPDGAAFTVYQVTKVGQLVNGSRIWYGDNSGNRWVHISAF